MMLLNGLERHRRIRDIICCPRCHGEVTYPRGSERGGIMLAADIDCAGCGVIGLVCNGKFIFNGNTAFVAAEDAKTDGGAEERALALAPGMFLPEDAWRCDHGRYWSEKADAVFRFNTDALGVNIGLLKHCWAGEVMIRANGRDLGTVDLFEANGSIDLCIPVYLGVGHHVVEVIVTGKLNAASASSQCHVVSVVALAARDEPGFAYWASNRGNPYPAVWPGLVDAMAEDALILDCGAGDRRYADDRVLNFEYSAFGNPEVFGDGHSLPFKADAFDLILSQAVIEHLYDPFTAVEEIRRTLKRGALAYAESAFMQPQHAVPFHFFNTTRWGIAKLFEHYQIEAVRSGGGTFATTLEWIYSLTELRAKGLGGDLDQLLSIARMLDENIDPEELDKFASFVTIHARKR